MVAFTVGDGEIPKRFLVHRKITCFHFPVFNAAFNSSFQEGLTQAYSFSDVTEAHSAFSPNTTI
jgi:hypothetical protein